MNISTQDLSLLAQEFPSLCSKSRKLFGKSKGFSAKPKAVHKPIPSSRKLDETPLYYITKADQLPGLRTHLMRQDEIAIDVEAVQDYVTLVQISTRTEDYILDPLHLWSHMETLKTVMADESIVKVLHASENDIKWLLSNFNWAIVNLFDTQAAQREFGRGRKRVSLKNTVKKFCGIELNKSINHYLWARRPLTTKQFQYARQDTHYLLEVYDILRAKFSEETRELFEKKCARLIARMTADVDNQIVDFKQRGQTEPLQTWCAKARKAASSTPEIKEFYCL